MPNRLAGATSPYLLQHADNPVDWWEWSDEAFAEAARRDVPVLLSVGYAACHWCHVMAHESFEDAATAAQVNAGFVAVKVDREERPDIDAVYMEATQAMTGQGGWPMTCFLTPDGEPFYCGTYYPTRAASVDLLGRRHEAWTGRRRRGSGARPGRSRRGWRTTPRPCCRRSALDAGALDAGGRGALAGEFDAAHGGFGGAPKFPPSMVLEFLLRHHERTGRRRRCGWSSATARARWPAAASTTSSPAGSPATASTPRWVVPHFEKMLYDNALLLRVYAHLRAGDRAAARWPAGSPSETAEFLLRDLRTPEGGFASALDADTDGVEGLTYAWTPAQLRRGARRRRRRVGGASCWSSPRRARSSTALDAAAAAPTRTTRRAGSGCGRRCSPRATGGRSRRATTRSSRRGTGWRSLALAEAGAALGRPAWVAAAEEAADLLLALHVVDGRLRRSRATGSSGHAGRGAGRPRLPGRGRCSRCTRPPATPRWLEQARAAARPRAGALRRPDARGRRSTTPPTTPRRCCTARATSPTAPRRAGAAALAGALLTASVLVADPQRYRAAAEAALAVGGHAGGALPAVRRALADGRRGRGAGARCRSRSSAPSRSARRWPPHARTIAPGGTVVVAGRAGRRRGAAARRPPAGRRRGAAAYVCRGFVCDRPVDHARRAHAALLLRA